MIDALSSHSIDTAETLSAHQLESNRAIESLSNRLSDTNKSLTSLTQKISALQMHVTQSLWENPRQTSNENKEYIPNFTYAPPTLTTPTVTTSTAGYSTTTW